MEIIPETLLNKRLPFCLESLSQWGEDTDLLQFLYELHDQPGVIVTEEGKEQSFNYRSYGKYIYNRGQEYSQSLVQHFTVAAQQVNPAPGAATQTITVPNFLDDPLFGKTAKYLIAWDSVISKVMSESAFFSITHVLESRTELDSSIYLASNFYYKQSLQVLRSFLEELILPIHFCDKPDNFSDWKLNNYRTPPLRDFIKCGKVEREGLLNELVRKKRLPQKIADKVSDLYGDLNGCIHGSEKWLIHKGFSTGKWMGHVFKYDDFCMWCKYVCGVVDVGMNLLKINVNQWINLKKTSQLLCIYCHNKKDFNTRIIEVEGKSYKQYCCCKCGKKMTLNRLKPVYKVKVIQTEYQTEQNFYFE